MSWMSRSPPPAKRSPSIVCEAVPKSVGGRSVCEPRKPSMLLSPNSGQVLESPLPMALHASIYSAAPSEIREQVEIFYLFISGIFVTVSWVPPFLPAIFPTV